ncbi:MAG: M48 family metalloprotease [Pseudomonadales bacterium]|nr:M48 family metalloprotease [Pseudomonadales bacterium]
MPLIRQFNHLFATAALLVVGIPATEAQAQTPLPTLGDRISGVFSLDQEYKMGREFLRAIRRSAPTLSDPLLNDYLVNFTHNLALHSDLQDYRLAFIIIDSPELNAFAAPGGIIGVNGGLFLNAQSEGEFASVMAHELAHVSQRHFARSVEDAQRRRIPELATLLASIVVMAGDPSAGQAAVMAAQGRALENRLRFSRENEAEADRVGIRNLFNAGYDPQDMPKLFERLIELNRFGRRPPEFLLSHPVTESRIADSRNRAERYPPRSTSASLEYLLMRARVQIYYEKDKKNTIPLFEKQLTNSQSDIHRKANSYGLALAYMANEQYNRAHELLRPLLTEDPNRISYITTQAEVYTESGETAFSRSLLARQLDINPGNHPLTMAMVDALIKDRDYAGAVALLERHAASRPEDHDLWYLIAETQGMANDISKVHQARAEYFILVGDFVSAREQIDYALRIESEKEQNLPLISKLRQRLRDVNEMERAARS